MRLYKKALINKNQDYQINKMYLGPDSSKFHYPLPKSPRPQSRQNSQTIRGSQSNNESNPAQHITPSSFFTNFEKQECAPKIVILPSQRPSENRTMKTGDSMKKISLIQKYNQNKSADKYTADHSFLPHNQKNSNISRDGFLNPKEILPPKPRKYSDQNSNLSQIMEKLQKKEELMQQIQKIGEHRVSDNIRKSSLEKPKYQVKNELNIPKYGGIRDKNEKSADKKPQKIRFEESINPPFKLTNYLSQLESSNKSEKKQHSSAIINKNPEENYLGGVQRTQYIWSKQPKLQKQLSRDNSRAKKSIEKVTTLLEIPSFEQNGSKSQVSGTLSSSYSLFNSVDISSIPRKYSTQNRPKSFLQNKQPQYKPKDLRNSIQTKQIKELINKLPVCNKKVSIHDFNLKKTLGQGKFGIVYQAFHIQTNTLYALKKISKQVVKSNLMVDQLLQEIKIQFYCNQQNILKIYGFFDDSQFIYLILEYMEQGTLFSLFKKEKTLTEKEAASKLTQIAAAIVYLQNNGIAHRDIKPENVVMSNGVGKLCDFGWAAVCTDRRKTYCGTFDYVAPEILQGSQYDETVDSWCLGVMAYELMVGKAPFYHISRKQTMKKIMNVQKTALQFPSHLSKNAISFIENLVRKNPEQRLNGQDILKHPFLAESINLPPEKRNH